MFKFKQILAILTLFCGLNLHAISQGVEYEKLSGDEIIKNAENSVIELFSYACIHCYNHFKIGSLEFVSDLLPELDYQIWQVRQMGEFGYAMSEVLAFAKKIDEANGIKSPLNKNGAFRAAMSAYFEATFNKRASFAGVRDFYKTGVNAINLALKNGGFERQITLEDLENFAASVEGKKLSAMSDAGLNIVRKSGTPAFVVNGKYLVKLEAVDSVEKLAQIIQELSKM